MQSLTRKQNELLRTINNYQAKYGRPPTLREMAKESHISDVKSVYRMIQILAQRGYLHRDDRKSRGILLTDFGINELGLSMLPKKLKVSPSILDNHKKPSKLVEDLSKNEVTVSLPTSNLIVYGNKNIKTDGTNINTDLRTIVETVVSMIMDKFTNGSTFDKQQDKYKLVSHITNFIAKGLAQDFLALNLGWLMVLIIAFFVYFKIINNSIQALLYACFSVVIINLLSKKGNS